jgi:glycosyltransferase involved in cell wall biosynthesis
MRILINGLFVVPNRVGGSETYLRGLIEGLARIDTHNDYILCVGPEAAGTFHAPNERWRVVASPTRSARRPQRLLLEQGWLPIVASRSGADLIHSAGYTAPLVSVARRVTSILDMNYRRHPEDLSLAERTVYSMLIPLVARRSHRVVTLSAAARADILRWTGARGSRVTAVPLAPRSSWPGDSRDDAARVVAAGITEPYILSVAAAYPHKNLLRLVQSFPLDDGAGSAVQLAVVGLNGKAQPSIQAAASRKQDHVKLLGWVDDGLLASLYRRALVLAFPSLYEGFGLPILEAMALGTPVLTSNFGAMSEVAGGAAELVDAYDVDSIRDGLSRLARDDGRRAQLRELGLRRASEFSWPRTARATCDLYTATHAGV